MIYGKNIKDATLFILKVSFLTLILSCHSNKNYEDIVDKSEYDVDIFDDKYNMIYGSWRLQKIVTGWGEISPDFDYIDIKPFGIFSIFKNDTKIANGRIEIINQNEKVLVIRFETKNNINLNLFSDNEKSIFFDNRNKILMVAPCCDRPNYELRRK
jgi:hypothetical protein